MDEKIHESFKPWNLRKHNMNASNSEALIKKEIRWKVGNIRQFKDYLWIQS